MRELSLYGFMMLSYAGLQMRYISSKLERLGVATNLKRLKPVELIRPY